jgi:hypothetical protein
MLVQGPRRQRRNDERGLRILERHPGLAQEAALGQSQTRAGPVRQRRNRHIISVSLVASWANRRARGSRRMTGCATNRIHPTVTIWLG